eukprot:603784-Pleurochrysis_carterae.AAC.1
MMRLCADVPLPPQRILQPKFSQANSTSRTNFAGNSNAIFAFSRFGTPKPTICPTHPPQSTPLKLSLHANA